MKWISMTWMVLLMANHVLCQSLPQHYFQGYSKDISGTRFGYHSPIPTVTNSLLLRGRADFEPIVWQTESVPEDYDHDMIRFIWLFGMDVTADPVDFELFINDQKWFSFSSSKSSDLGYRTINGAAGATLIFNITMLDRHEDQMGFALLTVPLYAVKKGVPNLIKISSSSTENNAWFMTYRSEIKEEIKVYQNKVVVKGKDRPRHSVSIDVLYLGNEDPIRVRVEQEEIRGHLRPGHNKLELDLPLAEDTTEYVAQVQIASRDPVSIPFTLAPIRPWEIFLVQHTHTDIGYTRPQTEILPEHLRYIDQALDFCDQTDHYPVDAQFRWTCETSWSVREYLKRRPPEQVQRLIQRIREGRIEATGMFLNYSEIIDEAALAQQTKVLHMLKHSGIDVTTAMQNDVNGIGWSMIDLFHQTDVKYLTMGIHAHRARKPFPKPTAFWWESPAGNRLLAYRSEHYQHGNRLSLTNGQQDVFRSNLSEYLTDLEQKGYPYDKISLQFSGYVTDNSPPSIEVCDIIKDWNAKYEWPKLRNALARDFMVFLDEQHHHDMSGLTVAWPDWWTDGVASAANETKVARTTHAKISAVTGLMAMAKMKGVYLPERVSHEVDHVFDHLLFYDEHTHGAAESVSDPLAQNTINQWNMKSAYAWEAAKISHMVEEEVLALIEPLLGQDDKPRIAVFNTLNWPRSGLVRIFLPHEIATPGLDFRIVDSDGREQPYQKYAERQEGTYYGIWVNDIPAFGWKIFEIRVGEPRNPDLPVKSTQTKLENEFYELELNPSQGIVSKLYDKILKIDLIDGGDSLTMGHFIYEQLQNRHDLERLTNDNRDTVYRPLKLTRIMLADVQVQTVKNGSIYQSVHLHGSLPECADHRGVEIEIRLYHHTKKIELLYRMHKLAKTSPEAVYIAFPFKLDQGHLAFEVQGGLVRPGKNQLPGSASDWNTIQSFASVRNDKSQILFTSNEIPLVQFGEINTGRYYYRLNPKTNHLFSWVLNNYWVTNFKASQEGELQWTYTISSKGDPSDGVATRFGWGERIPMATRLIFPSNATSATSAEESLLDLNKPNLLLVNTTISLDNKGIVLHVRELEGQPAIIDLPQLLKQTGALSAELVNVLEEVLEPSTATLSFNPYETKFLKLNLIE